MERLIGRAPHLQSAGGCSRALERNKVRRPAEGPGSLLGGLTKAPDQSKELMKCKLQVDYDDDADDGETTTATTATMMRHFGRLVRGAHLGRLIDGNSLVIVCRLGGCWSALGVPSLLGAPKAAAHASQARDSNAVASLGQQLGMKITPAERLVCLLPGWRHWPVRGPSRRHKQTDSQPDRQTDRPMDGQPRLAAANQTNGVNHYFVSISQMGLSFSSSCPARPARPPHAPLPGGPQESCPLWSRARRRRKWPGEGRAPRGEKRPGSARRCFKLNREGRLGAQGGK